MGDFISYKLIPIIFNMSVTASVVILFVLLTRLLLKKAPKIFSYALWTVVLFRLLCPVSVTAGFSLLGLVDAPASETTAHTSVVAYVPQNTVPTPAPELQLPEPDISQAVNEALPHGEEQSVADPLEAPVSIAARVWLLGVAAMAAYSVISYLRLRRTLVEAVPLRGNLYLADGIDSPFVMGLVRPKIYLPCSLPEREQPYIILHEQYHIRRLDHIVKALAFAALCVHWFNPLVWVAFVLSSKDMEMSCDEAVVKKLGESIRADYSASLLSLATGRRIIAGTPLAFGEGDTKSRIKNMLNWKQPRLWATVTAAAVCVAVVAACGANPQEKPDEESAAVTGQYASMEEYVQSQVQTAKDTNAISYYYYIDAGTPSDDSITDTVADARAVGLERHGTLEGLAPEGTLEVWEWTCEVKPTNAENREILMAGGSYVTDDGYIHNGGELVVALCRGDSGRYDILSVNHGPEHTDFWGYHNSYEEAIYDWYVTENDLDLPLYVEDWIDRITMPEDGHLGNFPVHRFDGDGWYLYVPISAWEQTSTAYPDDQWIWTSGYETGSTLTVDRFSVPVSDQYTVARKQGFVPLDETNQVWERKADTHTFYYFHEASDEGCWRVTIDWDESRITDYPYIAIQPQVLRLMAESFTVDSRFAAKPRLTLEDVLTLSQKEEALAWADFEEYSYIETGSGLYIRVYQIDERFSLSIGGGWLDETPMYIYLTANDDQIDVRTGDVAGFIDNHRPPESSTLLTTEELAWFNDWLLPFVQDKQGNIISLNVRNCFLMSYYDDVREMNFEEFMRYFPGDGSKTSDAEFEALRGIGAWPFGSVESLEKMPVPVHKYPRRLVDLILGEYAGISTADLDTSGVAYLPEYDAYYNYTSDADFVEFTCNRGERNGDLIQLYDANDVRVLTLRQTGEQNYQIVSYQLLEDLGN